MKSLTPNLMVEDVNKSVDFYRDVLGFKVNMTWPQEGKLEWAGLEKDGVTIAFQSKESILNEYPNLQKEIGGSVVLYIIAEDVDTLHDQLKSKVGVVNAPHDTFYGMREFAIRDCNGYFLNFAQGKS